MINRLFGTTSLRHPSRRATLQLFGIVAFLLEGRFCQAAAHEWKPVTPVELKMTGVPEAPGAAAVCLFSELFTDDVMGHEHHYVRIKVLTEEGRSQGNIEIPYVKGDWELKDLQARTVQPDGSVADYTGTPTDVTILRYRRFKTLAKTMALPAIQMGTIIEYQYDLKWDNRYLYSNSWVVNGDLFTLRASFVRRPSRMLNVHWHGSRLPEGMNLDPGVDGLIRLELRNVAASQAEDFMPAEAEIRPRVDFYYYAGPSLRMDADMDKVWAEKAAAALESIGQYLSKDHGLDRFLAETVKPEDTPEVRLRKLYDRVQSLRNLSYEQSRTKAEYDREKLKPPENVGDVVKCGYGTRDALDMLFLALAHKAGFEAWLLDVAQRDGSSFDPRSLTLQSLPGRAVMVHAEGKDYFVDPGTVLLPFGWLPWGATSVKALRLDKTRGGFVMTPGTAAAESAVERKASLKLDERGALEGIVTITYSGLEAFNRRADARDLDNMARRHMLESELQQWIPANAEAQLQNQPTWARSDPTLTAEFHVRVAEWAIPVGRRLLCPEGVFSGGERGVFQAETRIHDMYFPFPSETQDNISILIPDHFQIEALPQEKSRDLGFLSYKASVEGSSSAIRISRRVTLGRISLPTTVYSGVRAFYQDLRSADDLQIVLAP